MTNTQELVDQIVAITGRQAILQATINGVSTDVLDAYIRTALTNLLTSDSVAPTLPAPAPAPAPIQRQPVSLGNPSDPRPARTEHASGGVAEVKEGGHVRFIPEAVVSYTDNTPIPGYLADMDISQDLRPHILDRYINSTSYVGKPRQGQPLRPKVSSEYLEGDGITNFEGYEDGGTHFDTITASKAYDAIGDPEITAIVDVLLQEQECLDGFSPDMDTSDLRAIDRASVGTKFTGHR
jgi:hypothetical protein